MLVSFWNLRFISDSKKKFDKIILNVKHIVNRLIENFTNPLSTELSLLKKGFFGNPNSETSWNIIENNFNMNFSS